MLAPVNGCPEAERTVLGFDLGGRIVDGSAEVAGPQRGRRNTSRLTAYVFIYVRLTSLREDSALCIEKRIIAEDFTIYFAHRQATWLFGGNCGP